MSPWCWRNPASPLQPELSVAIQSFISDCLDDISIWITHTCLKLNMVKTKFLVFLLLQIYPIVVHGCLHSLLPGWFWSQATKVSWQALKLFPFPKYYKETVHLPMLFSSSLFLLIQLNRTTSNLPTLNYRVEPLFQNFSQVPSAKPLGEFSG